jgi:hypothetical protein
MDEELRELDRVLTLIQGSVRDLLEHDDAPAPGLRGVQADLESASNRLYDLLPLFAAPPTVTARLEEVIALRPLSGDPLDGPYPASVEDVAEEIHAFVVELEDSGTANGVLDALLRSLGRVAWDRNWRKVRKALQPVLDEIEETLLRPRLVNLGIDPATFRLNYDLEPVAPREADPFE